VLARALHAKSARAQQAFVVFDCGAVAANLIESELFGHVKGAFTGAISDRKGAFEQASGGTIFLDEIGELPLEAQAKLLRVLQDGEVRPVGGLDSRQVNVRVIAASNRTLLSMRDARMRQDLFFRLSVLVIEIPPLRERREDLPLLAAHFLSAIRERGVHAVNRIEPAALELLGRYSFPGNIRELENLLEGVSLTLPADRHVIGAEDVQGWLRHRGEAADQPSSDASHVPLRLAELEAWAISEALRQSHGNKRLAARMLGISRDTLYRKIHELNLAHLPDSRT